MNTTTASILGTIATIFIIALAMWGLPQYKVYSAEKAGEAELMEARQNRQIQIEEAQANLESEELIERFLIKFKPKYFAKHYQKDNIKYFREFMLERAEKSLENMDKLCT